MAMCVVANIIASYIMTFLQMLGIPQPPMPDTLTHTPLSLGLNLLVFAVLPALLEEMAFRGYVLRTLRPYGDRTAILVSSLLFALMHGNVLQVPFAFIVGLVLGYVTVQTDNIWLAVVIHFCNNAMSTVLQYLQMGMSAEAQNRMTTLVFCVLALVGLLALILLKARGSRLAAPGQPERRRDAHDPAFERAGVGAGLYDCGHRVYSAPFAEHSAERDKGRGIREPLDRGKGAWAWRTKPICAWRWSWRGRRRRKGRCPVGAVVVRDGEVIATGRNRRETARHALAHAEIEAIAGACARLGGWRLSGCDLYVTLEPCPMSRGPSSTRG